MTIERTDFQKLLFRTAFCIMACDGDIDEREVAEIKKMNQSAAYFQGIDLSNELEALLTDLKEKGNRIVDELFDTLDGMEISTVQELLILEVTFRIIYADERVDENEIKFLRYLRSKLKVHNEIIRDRFGFVEYLFDKDYSQNIIKKEVHDDLFSSLIISEVKEIQSIDLSDGKED
jgi:uncharacterized tellurite resistance protein B-like protein